MQHRAETIVIKDDSQDVLDEDGLDRYEEIPSDRDSYDARLSY